MIGVAKAASDEEVQASAAYFSALKPRARQSAAALSKCRKNFVQFETRDARSRFIAYVPIGSLKKGEALAPQGAGSPAAHCATCHGSALQGLGDVPALAGRPPAL
jgi:cytochrome c553